MEAGADLRRCPSSGGIDSPLSTPGADPVNDQSGLVARKANDFMPGPAVFGENRGEDTSWKHSDSPYSYDRAPYTGPRTMGNRTATERAGRDREPARRAGVPGHGDTPRRGHSGEPKKMTCSDLILLSL